MASCRCCARVFKNGGKWLQKNENIGSLPHQVQIPMIQDEGGRKLQIFMTGPYKMSQGPGLDRLLHANHEGDYSRNPLCYKKSKTMEVKREKGGERGKTLIRTPKTTPLPAGEP